MDTYLNFQVDHFTMCFDKRPKWMKRCYWPSFYTCNKDVICIFLVLLHKIRRGLFSGNSDQRHPFVSRFEPDNLWFVLLAIMIVAVMTTLSSLPFGFLLLLCRLAAGPKEAEGAGEHLAWGSFYYGDNMAGIKWLLFITNLILFHKQNALT